MIDPYHKIVNEVSVPLLSLASQFSLTLCLDIHRKDELNTDHMRLGIFSLWILAILNDIFICNSVKLDFCRIFSFF